MAADVAGFSRLVGEDEEATLAALRAHRSEFIDPLVETHGGRLWVESEGRGRGSTFCFTLGPGGAGE